MKTKTVIHVLTTSIDPKEGGMEQATVHISNFLGSIENTQVFLYTWNMLQESACPSIRDTCQLVNVTPTLQALYPPELTGNTPPNAVEFEERIRIHALLLQNEVRSRIAEYSDASHIIIS